MVGVKWLFQVRLERKEMKMEIGYYNLPFLIQNLPFLMESVDCYLMKLILKEKRNVIIHVDRYNVHVYIYTHTYIHTCTHLLHTHICM